MNYKQSVITRSNIEIALMDGNVDDLFTHLENVVVDMALIRTHGNTARAARMCNMGKWRFVKIRDRERAKR